MAINIQMKQDVSFLFSGLNNNMLPATAIVETVM